jgi:hypothetical protein
VEELQECERCQQVWCKGKGHPRTGHESPEEE